MRQAQTRSAEEVLEDHLREAKEGSVEADLRKNFSEDLVVLTGRGAFRGHEGMRKLDRILQEELPKGNITYRTKLVVGEMAFLEWTAESEQAVVEDGADSYCIRDGRIVAQTIHYTVKKKE
jgi:hypothetical protein